VIDEEFRSLTPADREPRRGCPRWLDTILARQVTEFGAVVRPIPAGAAQRLETF